MYLYLTLLTSSWKQNSFLFSKSFSPLQKQWAAVLEELLVIGCFGPLLQSGLSSRAKHGGTVFSAVSGSIKDLATVPGSYNHLGPWNFMTFAPALVFLTVVNIYSFAIEFGGCICYFWSKWISRAKFLTFPGDGRPKRGWIACNMQWLFMFFWMKNIL